MTGHGTLHNLQDNHLLGLKLLKQVELGDYHCRETKSYYSFSQYEYLHLPDSILNYDMTALDWLHEEAYSEMYGIWQSYCSERGLGVAAADWSLFISAQFTCSKG